jgi:Zn-dependent protease
MLFVPLKRAFFVYLMKEKRLKKHHYIQLLLFVITFVTTTIAGAEWRYGTILLITDIPFSNFFLEGLQFSIPFLLTLTVHEFGHYFTARANNLNVSLPYYIPMYFFIAPSIGTMGAFIRIREIIHSRRVIFDVGLAGPLAGFVIAIGVLFYGFTNLPPESYVYDIHPEYYIWGENYEAVYQFKRDTIIYKENLTHLPDSILVRLPDEIRISSETFKLGTNLIFEFFKKYVATHPERIPNHYEVIHYPWLFAGFLALFFTALNLIPIGQLDGGHILFGLIGFRKHRVVSVTLFIGFIFYAGLGLVTVDSLTDESFMGLPSYISKPGLYLLYLYMVFYSLSNDPGKRLIAALSVFAAQYMTTLVLPGIEGNFAWLVIAFLIGRFLGIYHPPTAINEPLNWKRKILGWIALAIFVLSFSPQVFEV